MITSNFSGFSFNKTKKQKKIFFNGKKIDLLSFVNDSIHAMPSFCDYKNCHNLASSTYQGYCNAEHLNRALQMEPRTDFQKFKEEYGFLVEKTDCWDSLKTAFHVFNVIGHHEFMKQIRDNMEYVEFCSRFYSDLREMYNICSAGMREAYEGMKAKGWSLDEYANDLEATKKTMRESS